MMNALEKENGVFETGLINSSLMDPGPSQRPEENKTPTLLDTLTGAIRGKFPEQDSQPLEANEDDRFLRSSLPEKLKNMSIELPEYRFFGKSSEATLIRKVIAAKRDYAGDDKWHLSQLFQRFRPEFWGQQSVGHISPVLFIIMTDFLTWFAVGENKGWRFIIEILRLSTTWTRKWTHRQLFPSL